MLQNIFQRNRCITVLFLNIRILGDLILCPLFLFFSLTQTHQPRKMSYCRGIMLNVRVSRHIYCTNHHCDLCIINRRPSSSMLKKRFQCFLTSYSHTISAVLVRAYTLQYGTQLHHSFRSSEFSNYHAGSFFFVL